MAREEKQSSISTFTTAILLFTLLYFVLDIFLTPIPDHNTINERFLNQTLEILKKFENIDDYENNFLNVVYPWSTSEKLGSKKYDPPNHYYMVSALNLYLNSSDVGKKVTNWTSKETNEEKILSAYHDLVLQVNSLNISTPNWDDWKRLRILDEVIGMQCELLEIFCCWVEKIGFALHSILKYLIREEWCQSYTSSHLQELEKGKFYRKNYFGNSSDEKVAIGMKKKKLPCYWISYSKDNKPKPWCLGRNNYEYELIQKYALNLQKNEKNIQDERKRIEIQVLKAQNKRFELLQEELERFPKRDEHHDIAVGMYLFIDSVRK